MNKRDTSGTLCPIVTLLLQMFNLMLLQLRRVFNDLRYMNFSFSSPVLSDLFVLKVGQILISEMNFKWHFQLQCFCATLLTTKVNKSVRK